MSDWIDPYKLYGERPRMGTCGVCGRRFVVEEGPDCDCSREEEDEDGDTQ